MNRFNRSPKLIVARSGFAASTIGRINLSGLGRERHEVLAGGDVRLGASEEGKGKNRVGDGAGWIWERDDSC